MFCCHDYQQKFERKCIISVIGGHFLQIDFVKVQQVISAHAELLRELGI